MTTVRKSVLVCGVYVFMSLWGCIGETGKMDNSSVKQIETEGSCCTYVSYAGNAEIVKIARTSASVTQAAVLGGPGYEGYEVWFRFIPHKGVYIPIERQSSVTRLYLFTLQNSWYAGSRYLEKYHIKVGETYPSELKFLTKGTCAPVICELKTLDRTDYFEMRVNRLKK